MKRIAICLFGHLRVYEKTYKNFYINIIQPIRKSGYEIDIFLHCWDKVVDVNYRHINNLKKLYPTLWNQKVDIRIQNKVTKIYSPKSFIVESGSGMYQSVKRVSEIYRAYEQEHKINYDFVLYTRYDVMFFSPFDFKAIEFYFEFNQETQLEQKINITFSAYNYYNALPFLDPRFINEGDIFWINNFYCDEIPPRKAESYFVVVLKYCYYIDFIVWREITSCKPQYRLLEIPIRAKHIPITWTKTKGILFPPNATIRIHSHLAYKLGSAMILNSKSLWGYIRMPYVLSYIKESHREEQRKYQARIAKNPSLKLPKLESYPDYKEAIKEKQCFTYKLGEALIKANNVRGGGANICLFAILPRSA